jgi:hypothetical protein
MPISWIEKNTTAQVKTWAFNQLKAGDVVFADDRQKEGYPVVAEIDVAKEDIKSFAPDLDNAVTVIMFHKDLKPIDDPGADYGFNDITFHIECVI